MTAITKNYTGIADAAIDPDAPLLSSLMYALRDNIIHTREWLGASYTDGAAQDHSHNGVDSSLVPVGSNALRNGSFESGIDGWSVLNYMGGANAINTANAMDGMNCLAITSTVLANGGAYAETIEYKTAAKNDVLSIKAQLNASVANISSKIEVIWYDSAKAQISASVAYSTAATRTTGGVEFGFAVAPTNTKFYRVRITGGVPATGSATGTVYFDGIWVEPLKAVESGVNLAYMTTLSLPAYGSTAGNSPVKVREFRVSRSGFYTVRMNNYSTTPAWSYSQIYKNGVAYGTNRQSVTNTGVVGSWDETLWFNAGDLCQFYAWSASAGYSAYATGAPLEKLPIGTVQTL